MAESSVGAIILAGGPADEDLAAEAGEKLRALSPVNGRPIASYVIGAAKESQLIKHMVVATEPPAVGALGLEEGAWIASAATAIDNVVAGAKALPGSIEHIVLCPCDIPLTTGPMLDRFIRGSLDLNAPVCYALLARAKCTGALSDVRKTWFAFKEGQFAGGNVALLSRRFLTENEADIRGVFELRKRPLALVAKLGIGILLRFALSRYLPVHVPMHTAEERTARVLGCKARFVCLEDSEIGVDVDRPKDLRFVSQMLNQGSTTE